MIFVGTIERIYPPTDPSNSNGYQYEYRVSVTLHDFSKTSINNCILSDSNGDFDDYEDRILKPGSSVLVAKINTTNSVGVIIGAIRTYRSPMDISKGSYWKKRYNKVEIAIDNNNNYSVTSDAGPFLQIQTALVQLDNSVGDNIILDKNAKTMTINSNAWTVNVVGDANINVGGDLNANVKGKTNVTSKGDLTATTEGNATVKAKGNANVKGMQVALNNPLGQVLTNVTQPVVDLITNVPSVGVMSVQAGDGGS